MINCLAVVNILLKNSTKIFDVHYNLVKKFCCIEIIFFILKDLSWYASDTSL